MMLLRLVMPASKTVLSSNATYRPLRSSLPGLLSVNRVIEELCRSGVCQHSGEKFHLHHFRAGVEELLAY
jgi:hypothetical protein